MAFQSLYLKFTAATAAVGLVAVFKDTCSAMHSACCSYTRQRRGIVVWLLTRISGRSMRRYPAKSVQSQNSHKQLRF